MSDNILDQLLAAQSPEEETKILLNSLPESLSQAAWAAAIPHWFNAEIIAALLPEFSFQADELYLQLQKQTFVESFQERGHNIHELTRKRILNLWWTERAEEYRELSKKADVYFSSKNDDLHLIEAAYHQLVSQTLDSTLTTSRWSEIASRLKISGQYALAHTLIQNTREHIFNGRIPESMEKLIVEWEKAFAGELESIGEEKRKERDLVSATEIFSHAQKLFADIKDKKAEANITVKLGATYFQQKHSDAAIKHLEDALRIYQEQGDIPGTAEAYRERGRIYRELEQLESAIADFKHAIELDPNNVMAIAGRGETYRLMKQYEEAIVDFNLAIELDPKDAWAIASRAQTYLSLKQIEAAIDGFNRAIELNPDYEWAIAHRGQTYASIEQYKTAIDDFNRAIELNPNYDWAIAQRAESYRLMKQYEAAIADFNRTIELDPNYAWAIARRGQTYASMEQFEAAIADFNRAIELDPNYAWAIANRAQTYASMKQYETAIDDFNRAIELNTDYAWAIAGRAQTYASMEQYEAAIADFNHIIELNPNEDWTIAHRGQTYASMEQFEAAIADFNRAIELDPNYAWAIANRAQTYASMEQYEAAIADFNRAIELTPDVIWIIASRSLAYSSLKQYESAIADLNHAIELTSDINWLSVLTAERGNIYRLIKKYDAAIADFNRAIELNPNYDWAIAHRARTYESMEQYEVAIVDFNRAIELNPTNIASYISLSNILRFNQTDREEEALALQYKIIGIDLNNFNSYLAIASISKKLNRDIPNQFIENARQLMPEDSWYNRACLESVSNNFDLAFEHLQKAAQKENFDPDWAWKDPDLKWIRDDPRFTEIVGPKPEK